MLSNRRRIVLALGACVGGLPILTRVRAESLTPLDQSVPAAKALHYVDNAADADEKLYPKDATPRCETCQYFTALEADWGKCALFPGHKVRRAGWCSGWVAKAS